MICSMMLFVMEEINNTGFQSAITALIGGAMSLVIKGAWDFWKNKNDNKTELEKAKIDDWKKRYMELEESYAGYRDDAKKREYKYQEKQKGLQDQIRTLEKALDKASRFMSLSLKLLKTTTDPNDVAINAVISEMDKIYKEDG